MSSEASTHAGPLTGLRVIELASEHAAFAGKLLADYGAEVLLVEPIGGHRTRTFGPFAESLPEAHPDRSLWFWHYNTSKQGVQIDLDTPEGADQFRTLVGFADIVLEGETPGRLAALGLDHGQIDSPTTVWVSVTSFGRSDPRSLDPFSDLTAIAGGGLAWSCGYDDHSLPPMAPLGNQGYQTASIWAAVGALIGVIIVVEGTAAVLAATAAVLAPAAAALALAFAAAAAASGEAAAGALGGGGRL